MDSPIKGGRALRLGALGLAILLAVAVIWVASAGPALLQSCEPAAPSDMMIVLAGGSRERLLSAVDLFQRGMAPFILVTDPYGFPDGVFRLMESAGIPQRALLAAPDPSHSTYEDGVRIRDIAVRRSCRSLLVVTSGYHCRRAQIVLSRAMAGTGIRVTVTGSASLYMDSGQWWTSRQGWVTVAPEFLKLVGAELGV